MKCLNLNVPFASRFLTVKKNEWEIFYLYVCVCASVPHSGFEISHLMAYMHNIMILAFFNNEIIGTLAELYRHLYFG